MNNSSQLSRKMLFVGPYETRPRNHPYILWSSHLISEFAKLGWQSKFFPYRNIYYKDPIHKFTRHRIHRFASSHLQRAFLDAVLTYRPDIVFLEKAELLSPMWVKKVKELIDVIIVFYNPDDPQAFSQLGSQLGPVSDIVLTSSELCVKMYHDLGTAQAHYMPFWGVPVDTFSDPSSIPVDLQSDISFAGSYYPERDRLFLPLATELLNQNVQFKIWGNGWDHASDLIRRNIWTGRAITDEKDLRYILQGCKIALNAHLVWMKHGGMKSNVRTYEAMANGAFVLSDRTVGIDDLFAVGQELICYDSPTDLIAKVKHFLASPEERREIAARGYAAVKERYTLTHWVERAHQLIVKVLAERDRGLLTE